MTQEEEIWIEMKDIKENTFISNFGRVKKIFLNGKTKITTGSNHSKINKTKCTRINKNNLFIHDLVGKYFVKNINPNKYKYINHKSKDKSNNHYSNLIWKENKTRKKMKKRKCNSNNNKNKKGCIRSTTHNTFQFFYQMNKNKYSKTFKTEKEALIAQKYYISVINLIEFQ